MTSTREEQRRLERLHGQAEKTAADLYAGFLRSEEGSAEAERLKGAYRRARGRTERRYKASAPKPA